MRFAVLACPACGNVQAVEARSASAACQRCRQRFETATRPRLWQGDDARTAQAAAAAARAGPAAVTVTVPSLPRHDSALEAAAAQASAVVNRSQRAEIAALWLTRLQGMVSHSDLLQTLAMAGLEQERAELEVTRMLACDVITEPRAGFYRMLENSL